MPFGAFERKSCAMPPTNPTTAPVVGPLEDGEHDRDEVDELRLRPDQRHVGEDRRLQQQGGDEHDDEHEDAAHARIRLPASSFLTHLTRTSSDEKSTAGRTVTLVVQAGRIGEDARHVPIGMFGGYRPSPPAT